MKNQKLPNINKYLDLSTTPALDWSAEIQDRMEKASQAYYEMRPFLVHKHIPAPIKMQFIKSFLMPIATY